MTSANEERNQALLSRILKLLDVKPVSEKETVMLKHVSHSELCTALQYWIDQTKMIFGEVVWTQQNQNRRDDGVDFFADLPRSKLRFGFQPKSYRDVKDDNFFMKVRSQVTQSHKHGIFKLIVAFSGDLTDKSQNEKIRGLTSELHEVGDYVITIPPEKVVVIVNAFRNKEHPLKFVSTSMQDASMLLSGVSESLSDDQWKATTSITIERVGETKPEESPLKISFTIKTSKEKAGYLDAIQRAGITGETVEIDGEELEDFQVFERGRPIFSDDKKSKLHLTLIPEKPKTPPLNLESVSEDGKVIETLKGLILLRDRTVGDEIHVCSENKNHPLQFEIISKIAEKSGKFSFSFDPARGDAVQVLESAIFAQSLKKAKQIRFVNAKTGKVFLGGSLSQRNVPEIDAVFMRFVGALATIQRRTGYRMQLPTRELEKTKIENVFIIAEGIEKGRIPVSSTKLKIKIPRIQALKMLDDYQRDGTIKDLIIQQQVSANVLDQVIQVGPGKMKPPRVRPVGNVDEIRKQFLNSKEDSADLELETFGEGAEFELEWFSASS